jgi:hypothetical protein
MFCFVFFLSENNKKDDVKVENGPLGVGDDADGAREGGYDQVIRCTTPGRVSIGMCQH